MTDRDSSKLLECLSYKGGGGHGVNFETDISQGRVQLECSINRQRSCRHF